MLRVDLPGYGETTGFMDDAPGAFGAACVRFLASVAAVDARRIHTIGHCAGGMFAMGAATRETVAGVTVVSSPMKLNAYAHKFPHSTFLPLMRAMNKTRRRDCFTALASSRAKVPLTKVGVPVLAVYGGRDAMIPAGELDRICRYVQGPVTPLFFEDEVHVCPRQAMVITAAIIDQVHQGWAGAQVA